VARPDRILTVAAVAALTLASAVLAVIGAFYSLYKPHIVHVPVPVGVLIAVVGNLAIGLLGAFALRTRSVPAITGFVWLVVAFVLSSRRPEGDLIVTGSGLGVAFLFLGAIAASVAIAIGPGSPRRRSSILHPRSPRADDALSRVED
jgi:hypothetical protein